MGLFSRFEPPAASPAPLRVGWIVTPLSPGGTLTHLRRWAAGLDPGRVRPTLFYHSPEEDAGEALEFPEAVPRVRLSGLDLSRRAPREALRQTVAALRAHRIELVHSIFIGADLVALLASIYTRLPVMSSLEGALIVPHIAPARRTLLATLYRLLSPKFSAVTAVSRATAAGLEPYRRAGSTPVEVLYPGVAEAPARVLPSLEAGPLIVAVGRIAPVKGFPLLVEAVERLRKDRLPGLRAVIVGDGPDRDPLWALIRSRGLEQAVRITGWLPEEEVAGWLERAHLVAISSYREGMPWVALEAMARAVPVVAARVGGLPELIEEGTEETRTGWLVDPNDSYTWTATLARVLAEPGAAARLEQVGRNALARVRTHFTARAEAEALQTLYLRLTGRTG